MPRSKPANKPGTERYRDERRDGGGPKMAGHQWSDYEEPRDIERESMTAPDAVPEAESSGVIEGMGKAAGPLRGTTGAQRKRSTPAGKGPKKRR